MEREFKWAWAQELGAFLVVFTIGCMVAQLAAHTTDVMVDQRIVAQGE